MSKVPLFRGSAGGLLSYRSASNMDLRDDGIKPSPRMLRKRTTTNGYLGNPSPGIVRWTYYTFPRPWFTVYDRLITYANAAEVVSGALGAPITDMCEFEDGSGNGALIICYGNGDFIDRYDAAFTATPSTDTKLLYATMAGPDLYAITNGGAYSTYKISKCPAGNAPEVAANWGTGYPVGSPLRAANSLCSYNGSPFVGKPEGMFVLESTGDRYVNRFKWLIRSPHSDNCKGMFEAKTGVVVPLADGSLWLTDGYNFTDISPRKHCVPHRDAPWLYARITAGCDAGEWTYVATAPWEQGWTSGHGLTVYTQDSNGDTSASGADTTPTVTITSNATQLVVDALACGASAATTAGAGQTLVENASSDDEVWSAMSREDGAASVTMSWTIDSTDWATIAVGLNRYSSTVTRPTFGSSAVGEIIGTDDHQTFTVATTGNPLLLVSVAHKTSGVTVSSITYGTQSLTKLASKAGTNNIITELWYLIGPAPGSASLEVILSGAVTNGSYVIGAYYNVHQAFPFGVITTLSNVTDGNLSTTDSIAALGNAKTSYVYFAADVPFEGVNIIMGTVATAGTTATTGPQYYGSGGWTTIKGTPNHIYRNDYQNAIYFAKTGFTFWRDFYTAHTSMAAVSSKYWTRFPIGTTAVSAGTTIAGVQILPSRPPISSAAALAYTGSDAAGRFTHILAGREGKSGWEWHDLFAIPVDSEITAMAMVQCDTGQTEENIGPRLLMVSQMSRFYALMGLTDNPATPVNENYADGSTVGTPVVYFLPNELSDADSDRTTIQKTATVFDIYGEYVNGSDTLTMLCRMDHDPWDTAQAVSTAPVSIKAPGRNEGLTLETALAYEDPNATEIEGPRITRVDVEFKESPARFDEHPQANAATPELE